MFSMCPSDHTILWFLTIYLEEPCLCGQNLSNEAVMTFSYSMLDVVYAFSFDYTIQMLVSMTDMSTPYLVLGIICGSCHNSKKTAMYLVIAEV